MITTIIPYQQATLYQPAAPVIEKDKVNAGVTAPSAPQQDSIQLSAAARARLAQDNAAAGTADADSADLAESLQDAARRTLAMLKRNQGREFTASGAEITDPDTSAAGKAVVSLRAVTPQPVIFKGITA